MQVFLSHAHADATFVLQVASFLRKSTDVYCYEELPDASTTFPERLAVELERAQAVVVFVSNSVGPWQQREIELALELKDNGQACGILVVVLRGGATLQGGLRFLNGYVPIEAHAGSSASECAKRIVERLPGVVWRGDDDLPINPHLFSQEKKIIAHFSQSHDPTDPAQTTLHQLLKDGCPPAWPAVERWARPDPWRNRLSEEKIGKFRLDDALVAAVALRPGRIDQVDASALSFPEAGPRARLYFPHPGKPLKAAVLVSGGIAPGINAVIDGITQRHWDYATAHGYDSTFRLIGLDGGFSALKTLAATRRLLVPDRRPMPDHMPHINTAAHANDAGSILETARVEELLNPDSRIDELRRCVLSLRDVDILYVIGGDGSMRAAHALWSVAQVLGVKLSVVGIPKTMDNDILWVWQSFGFLSAVERARQVIEQLNTEISSNPRLCVVQLFGSDSGFVVSHAVAASPTGQCDLALVPEVPFSMQGAARFLRKRMRMRVTAGQSRAPLSLVVLAETAIPTDVLEFIEGPPELRVALSAIEVAAIREFDALRRQGRRIEGQTADTLRSAGLKIVTEGLRILLPPNKPNPNDPDWAKLRIFTNEPRHLLRAVRPSASDIIMGQRLGILAVDNALAGYTDFMMSYWLTEYVLVPLKLVVLGRKGIPREGIFWRSVLAKTKQPADLVTPWSNQDDRHRHKTMP